KRNVEKSMTALEVLGVTREELEARQLVKPETPRSASAFLEKLLSARVLSPSERVAASEQDDLLIVQGELHYYRIHRPTGRIERATDNAILELDWHALPDSMRMTINQTAGSPEQVMLRAHLLMHDAVFGRFFVRKPG